MCQQSDNGQIKPVSELTQARESLLHSLGLMEPLDGNIEWVLSQEGKGGGIYFTLNQKTMKSSY